MVNGIRNFCICFGFTTVALNSLIAYSLVSGGHPANFQYVLVSIGFAALLVACALPKDS